jgi:hypothetical protein
MTVVLLAIGALLALWGFYVLSTLDAIAALDVGSHLIMGGALVAALGGVIRAINRLRHDLVAAAPRMEPGPLAALESEVEADEAVVPPPVAAPTVAQPRPMPLPPTPPVSPAPAVPSARAPAVTAPAAAPVSAPAPAASERPVPDFLVRTATVSAAAAAAPAAVAGSEEPALLREGSLNGVNYRFYSDGAVEAEGASGTERYASLDALRAAILARRSRFDEGEPGDGRPEIGELRDEEPSSEPGAAPTPFIEAGVIPEEAWDFSATPAPRLDADPEYIEPAIPDSRSEMSDGGGDEVRAPSLDSRDRNGDEGLFYGAEDEESYDEPLVEAGEDRRERWSETLRMLLRRERKEGEATHPQGEPVEGDELFDFRKGPK